MKKSYYGVASLRRELRSFERQYDLPSEDFYAAHERGRAPAEVSNFDRVVWADTYREFKRMSEQPRSERKTAKRRPRRARALQPAG